MLLQCTLNTYFEFGCPFELSIEVGLRPSEALGGVKTRGSNSLAHSEGFVYTDDLVCPHNYSLQWSISSNSDLIAKVEN
jgi:hypothetical protein